MPSTDQRARPHTPPRRRTVLIDLTPLDTPTRHRGTGRYVHELALGLAALPPADLGDLRLLGLTRLGLNGSYDVTEDLASFGGTSPQTPSQADHYRWAYARRLALWRAVRRVGADVVHLGDPNATPLFMGLTACRRIVTCHDLIPVRYPARYFNYKDGGAQGGLAIERRRYMSADQVVAISEATRHDLSTLLGVPAHRVVRVYNGVDVDCWAGEPSVDAAATIRNLGLARPFVLYTGGFHWHKNVEGMAFGLAAARARGVELDLAWAGHLTPAQRAAVDDLARRAGVIDAVRYLGFVTDAELAVLYRTALAHVLVSRAEGFGLTVVEAMASGCPVVTTTGGSLAEVAGDAALTVGPDDHAAIGAALERLSQEPSLRRDLAARGRLRARLFTRSAQSRAMVRVYQEFLASLP